MINFSRISAKSLGGRLLRLPLALIPHNMVVPIMQGRIRGKKWIVGSSLHSCWLGNYEFEKQELFWNEVRPGSVVYDVGADTGFYTLIASDMVGTNGTVCAFEPLPRNMHYLMRHIHLNFCQNVMIFPVAVGDRQGISFFDKGTHSSSGRLTSSYRTLLAVSVVALDELLADLDIPVPEIIKIDVEGGELQVLRGAVSLLRTHHPTLLVATHGREVHRQCCEFLLALDYELRPITGSNLDKTDEVIAIPKTRQLSKEFS